MRATFQESLDELHCGTLAVHVAKVCDGAPVADAMNRDAHVVVFVVKHRLRVTARTNRQAQVPSTAFGSPASCRRSDLPVVPSPKSRP